MCSIIGKTATDKFKSHSYPLDKGGFFEEATILIKLVEKEKSVFRRLYFSKKETGTWAKPRVFRHQFFRL